MSSFEVIMLIFLGVVVIGGMLGFLIYNFKKEDE